MQNTPALVLSAPFDALDIEVLLHLKAGAYPSSRYQRLTDYN
jgi:hypothetical protein